MVLLEKLEKPSLQSRFTRPLPSKLFPAKIPFSKIQTKNLAGKNYTISFLSSLNISEPSKKKFIQK
jgi:hypothetical protein